jgi:hypothetical protein
LLLLLIKHAAIFCYCCCCQVLEPKDGKVVYKDWDQLSSDIGQLETFDDDEQPLPQNVSGYCWLCLRLL